MFVLMRCLLTVFSLLLSRPCPVPVSLRFIHGTQQIYGAPHISPLWEAQGLPKRVAINSRYAVEVWGRDIRPLPAARTRTHALSCDEVLAFTP